MEKQEQRFAHVAQTVERVLGKDEVTSSILVMGSRKQQAFRTERRKQDAQASP